MGARSMFLEDPFLGDRQRRSHFEASVLIVEATLKGDNCFSHSLYIALISVLDPERTVLTIDHWQSPSRGTPTLSPKP